MLHRRTLLNLGGSLISAVVGAAATSKVASAATTTCLPDTAKLKTRNVSKFEVIYKTPRGNPNGLALTNNPNEIWIINQAKGSHASLINIETGSLIREFETDSRGDSGICIDDDNVMWLTSTGNRLIVSCSPDDGHTIAKYVAPGAGRIYEEAGDPPARSTTLDFAYPRPPAPPPSGLQNVGATAGQLHPGDGKLPPGQVPLDMEDTPAGSGSHGIISKGNLLYVASPPSRTIFVIDKKTWVVQNRFPTPGNRPHGITWTDSNRTHFWNADSNLNAFFLYNAATGQITEKIQLADSSPVIHGAKLILNGSGAGYMYCCDDHGWMWRFKMPT
jgi:hypothetical protein